MCRSVIFLALLLATAVHCSSQFELSSPDIGSDGSLSKQFTCDNSEYGYSPALKWTDAPKGTTHFALAVYDESSYGIFNHWFLSSIPAHVTSLPKAASKSMPQGITTKYSYIPFCPPLGEKREYKFEIFALGHKLELPDDISQALTILRKNALGSAQIAAQYGQSKGSHSHHPVQLSPFQKRSMEAVLAGDDGGAAINTTICKSTNLSAYNTGTVSQTACTTAYIFPIAPISAPPANQWIFFRVIFTVTVTAGSGAICFNGGWNNRVSPYASGAVGPAAVNVPQHCYSPSIPSKSTIKFGITLPLGYRDDLNVQFYLIGQQTDSSTATFTISTSISQQIMPQIDNLILQNPGTSASGLTIPSINYVRIHMYPDDIEPTTVPQGSQQLITNSATVAVGAGLVTDNFQVCFGGGFLPWKNTIADLNNQGFSSVCAAQSSVANNLLTWSNVYNAGDVPPPPYVLVTGGAKTTRSVSAVQSISYAVTTSNPVGSSFSTPSSAGSGNVQFQFTFANMFVIAKSS